MTVGGVPFGRGLLAPGAVYAHRVRTWVPAVVGGASLAVSVGMLLAGATIRSEDTPWGLAEVAVLLALALVAVRVAPPGRLPVAVVPAVAVPAWLLRFGWGPVEAATLGGFAAWTLLASAAVAVGLYLRRLDADRVRSVTEARRAQRLQLAGDLHDFVAHDVSGMLAQAQAGQLLAERDPVAAAAAFRRIETAGLQALASLDRTVQMLRDADDGPPATLADLPGVVERFASTVDISLEVEPSLDPPREVAATAYRVIVEALTNVRRHAPGASRVSVQVHRAGSAVLVCVTDDGPQPTARASRRGLTATRAGLARRHGGLGLPGLAERVEALGGSLSAGPERPTGWRVTARLPLT
jgi:signal transduction histidine kinase